MKDLSKPHEFQWDGETPDNRGIIYCACMLPKNNPLHIKPTTKKKRF